MSNYKVSIIMPVYKVKDYIKESIESVCNQNFDSFELILVDDGDPEKNVYYAEKIINNRIPYKVVSQDNKGLPSARNTGLKYAEGEYVCFVDSDDIISANHIKELYEVCFNNNLIVSYSNFETTFIKNRNGKDKKINSNIYEKDFLLEQFLDRNIKIHCCSLMIKKEYMIENKLFFNEKLRYGEDTDFMWRLFPKCEKNRIFWIK